MMIIADVYYYFFSYFSKENMSIESSFSFPLLFLQSPDPP